MFGCPAVARSLDVALVRVRIEWFFDHALTCLVLFEPVWDVVDKFVDDFKDNSSFA